MEVKNAVTLVLVVVLIIGNASLSKVEKETTQVIDAFSEGNEVLVLKLNEPTCGTYNDGSDQRCSRSNNECSTQTVASVLGGYRGIEYAVNIYYYNPLSDFEPEIEGEIQINTSQGAFQSTFEFLNDGNNEIIILDVESNLQYISFPQFYSVCGESNSYNTQTLNLKKNGGEYLVIAASAPTSLIQWFLVVD